MERVSLSFRDSGHRVIVLLCLGVVVAIAAVVSEAKVSAHGLGGVPGDHGQHPAGIADGQLRPPPLVELIHEPGEFSRTGREARFQRGELRFGLRFFAHCLQGHVLAAIQPIVPDPLDPSEADQPERSRRLVRLEALPDRPPPEPDESPLAGRLFLAQLPAVQVMLAGSREILSALLELAQEKK